MLVTTKRIENKKRDFGLRPLPMAELTSRNGMKQSKAD
jgi:hypothetical protein